MKIYYYHTRPIHEALQEWHEKKHPGHILYGLTHFSQHGITCVLHKYRKYSSRLWLMCYNWWQVLVAGKQCRVVYGTSFYGLEILIFMRALGLFRKPIVVWHHQAIVRSHNPFKEQISRFFYRGIDLMFFFSHRLVADSQQAYKVPVHKMKVIDWGADMDFYNHLREVKKKDVEPRFISTGKEHRDFATLLSAFSETHIPLVVYSAKSNGQRNYSDILNTFEQKGQDNIAIHFVDGIIPYRLAAEVASSTAVVVACLPYPYTVGLTTVVEAMALGLPVVATRNAWYPMDIDAEGIGITVDYGDVNAWKNAVRYLWEHPQVARKMGQRGRQLAEQKFNLEAYTRQMSEAILQRFGKT